jgi:MerR family transcriptional regulator/heat shock protein HspR
VFDSKDRPLYIISVAAELVNMHPQTLRLYERRGLVCPKRHGKNRLYSQHDIERLIYIQSLTQELGINLAGVERIIRLQNELDQLKAHKEEEIRQISERILQLERMKRVREDEIADIKQKIADELADDQTEDDVSADQESESEVIAGRSRTDAAKRPPHRARSLE